VLAVVLTLPSHSTTGALPAHLQGFDRTALRYQRLSIVGYDNSPVARLPTVALTTIGQNAATLATSALDRATAWAG
jgi:DNA-binding LacI/PurR family transcriptional regulator